MIFLISMSAKNEFESVGQVINEFRKDCSRLGIKSRFQVIDDHSTDGTAELVKKMDIHCFQVEEGTGISAAFRTEVRYALQTDMDYMIHVDADGQHLASDLHLFIEKAAEGYELITGNRLHTKPVNMSELWFSGNEVLSKLVSAMARQRIYDSQTGYRAIEKKVLENCPVLSEYAYTQEQIIRAIYGGYRYCEVPITMGERRSGVSRHVRNPFDYLALVSRDLEIVAKDLRPDLLESW
jgi:glycosyltransferase involved in cell wall biosynthesis